MFKKRVPLYVALVHYPVLNRRGEIIASAVTNVDLHDLARASCTYDIPICYIVTPLKDQQILTKRLTDHWCKRIGKDLHPDRELALRRLRVVDDIPSVLKDIEGEWGQRPRIWATTARTDVESLSHGDARRYLEKDSGPVLLLLGTGWGLAPSVMREVDDILEAIQGKAAYNHLSVRCAAAILMDRLLSLDR